MQRRVHLGWLACCALANPALAQSPLSTQQQCWLARMADPKAQQLTVAQAKAACEPQGPAPGPSSSDPSSDTRQTLRAVADAAQAAKSAVALSITAPQSVITRRMASEVRASDEAFALLPHRQNYFLPVSYQSKSGQAATEQSTEAQFQISFKFPLSQPVFNGQLLPLFAYTGKAWWQIYNGEQSRPFREYNHEPEVMLGAPISGVRIAGWTPRLATLGFNHQSNGRSGGTSRSWNRVVAEVFADQGLNNWASLKVWQRVGEKAKTSAADADGDDNPDISRYLGHFEWRIGRVQPGGNQLSATVRKSFSSGGKGALQIDWSRPHPVSPGLRWYATAFDGYGDSLIDHDKRMRRLGLGIMVNDWF